MKHIYVDGSLGSGVSGYGYVIVDDEQIIAEGKGHIREEMTSTEAEMYAVQMGIFAFMLTCDFPQTFVLWCDNLAVVTMLQMRHENVKEITKIIHSLTQSTYCINWTPRNNCEFSTRADQLAKMGKKNVNT